MTQNKEHTGWQQLFTIESAENQNWVFQEVRAMLPAHMMLEGIEDEGGYIDVFCTPPLTPEELAIFEQQFDSFDFTDVAFVSSSGIHSELPSK